MKKNFSFFVMSICLLMWSFSASDVQANENLIVDNGYPEYMSVNILSSSLNTFDEKANGEYTVSSDLITYDVPSGYPQEGSPLFNIAVDGKYTGVYTDINAWSNLVSFGYFDFNPNHEVEVVVTSKNAFGSYEILPKSDKISSVREGNTIRFRTKKTDKAITIVFDNNYKGNVLHIFANSIDTNAPTESSDDLIYFGRGYHDLAASHGGRLNIYGNQKVYIAGGAVVNGTIGIESGNQAILSGRGILMKSTSGDVVLSVSYAQSATIDGVIIRSHRYGGWTVGFHVASNVTVRNAKVVSTRYASTDGFDIVNSNNINFNNVFIRSCDDAIAIKGLLEGNPANNPANENMYFENLQLWNDCNNGICLGAETRAQYYKNIHFKNVDVLFSYDDRDNHEQLDERSVMSIVCLEGTYFSDILFENFRVNRCERLICLTFKDSFWFGTLLGDQSYQGGINGVTFKNIKSQSNSGSSIANHILLNGWYKSGTPTKIVENITFSSVEIEGNYVTNASNSYIRTNNVSGRTLVKDLYFNVSPHPGVEYAGTGTANDPYQVTTAEELDAVRYYLNNTGIHFKMMNDIDLADFLEGEANGWSPVGPHVESHFKGTFDGDGKTIKNLVIKGNPDGAGLFGRLGAPGIIKNVTLDNANLELGSWGGALVATNGTWQYTGGTILNSNVINSHISGNTSLGGLVGVNESVVENCGAMNVIVSGVNFVGGLIGENNSDRTSSVYVRGSYSSGKVIGSGEAIGGLIGHNRIIPVETSFSFCDVTGGKYCGGLIGYNNSGATIKKCFATGNVVGQSAAGLVGDPQTGAIENSYAMGNIHGVAGNDVFSGGLNGAAYDCSFTNCYFNGKLSGRAENRALTGRAIRINFTNNFFNKTKANTETGYQDNENSTGIIRALTENEMRDAQNFTAILNSGNWDIWDGYSYPYLTIQSSPASVSSATATTFSGTFKDASSRSLYIFGYDETSGLYPLGSEVTINGNSWIANIADGNVQTGQYVYVVTKEDNKAMSYPVEVEVGNVIQRSTSGITGNVGNEIAIYYNRSERTIVIKDGVNAGDMVDIYSVSGQRIYSGRSNSNVQFTVPVQGYSDGVYIIKIKTRDGVKTQKINVI